MANKLRVKRRAAGGAAGAPASLENAELAFNEQDDTLYYGKGTGGVGGTATTIEVVGGIGAFVTLTTTQTISGQKTFGASPLVPTATPGDNTTQAASTAFVAAAITGGSVSDGDKGDITVTGTGSVWTVDAGAITNAKLATVATATFKGRTTAATGAPEDLTVAQARTLLAISNVTDTSDANKPVSTAQQTALDLKANAANAALTGVPVAPTAAPGTNTTQLATTAFATAAVAALVDAAPGTLDTLNELAAALGDDPNFSATLTANLAGKLAIASNLSDLANVVTARTNLELGTMATQDATAVAITGGTIDGITIDGGTF